MKTVCAWKQCVYENCECGITVLVKNVWVWKQCVQENSMYMKLCVHENSVHENTGQVLQDLGFLPHRRSSYNSVHIDLTNWIFFQFLLKLQTNQCKSDLKYSHFCYCDCRRKDRAWVSERRCGKYAINRNFIISTIKSRVNFNIVKLRQTLHFKLKIYKRLGFF